MGDIHEEIKSYLSDDTLTPATSEELLAVVKGARSDRLIESMVAEILIHRDAMAPYVLRAAKLYTDELGALRKRAARLEQVIIEFAQAGHITVKQATEAIATPPAD